MPTRLWCWAQHVPKSMGTCCFTKIMESIWWRGLSLYGASAFVFKPGARFFKGYSESSIAEALYVKTAGSDIAAFYETIFQRHQCFFRYSDISINPNDWNVSAVFQGNKASNNIGSKLFANTLQFCTFGRAGLINDAIKSWKSFQFKTHDGQPSNDDLKVVISPVQVLIHSHEWNNISPNEKFRHRFKFWTREITVCMG